ncbi:N-acetyltransferase GCN5 [Athelia psychrophila]|uniref:N-acetyltransferase GCN5 n=1 Tax=Athelia psychrophila TaxID=1759441 RepID=A0A167XG78_9AGAM|nr:N-acetyltransferase GCN5 [Fibularhizoctonia sp. CBS 109695]
MNAYTIAYEVPSSQDYCNLREATGLSSKAVAAAAAGLPNSLFCEPVCVGMARVIGDGALFFTVVDVAVHPTHQGHGLGIRLMKEIDAWLVAHVPKSGQVGLAADAKAQSLYAKFGFWETAPYGAVAMARAF